jgi:hypothetical protein
VQTFLSALFSTTAPAREIKESRSVMGSHQLTMLIDRKKELGGLVSSMDAQIVSERSSNDSMKIWMAYEMTK